MHLSFIWFPPISHSRKGWARLPHASLSPLPNIFITSLPLITSTLLLSIYPTLTNLPFLKLHPTSLTPPLLLFVAFILLFPSPTPMCSLPLLKVGLQRVLYWGDFVHRTKGYKLVLHQLVRSGGAICNTNGMRKASLKQRAMFFEFFSTEAFLQAASFSIDI